MITTATAQHCPTCEKPVAFHQLHVEDMGIIRGVRTRRCALLCVDPCRKVFVLVQELQGDGWVTIGRPEVQTSGSLFGRMMAAYRRFTGT